MGAVDSKRLDHSAGHLALAGGDHVHVEVVCLEIADHLDHGQVERLAVRHARKPLDVSGGHEVRDVRVELVGGHTRESLGEGVVIR